MRSLKSALLLAMLPGLAACGADDCNSGDVHKTIVSMFTENSPPAAIEVYEAAKFSGVVTIDKDTDTGYFACKADIELKMPNGKEISKELAYEVSRVESDDADFEVNVDRKAFNVLRYDVNVPINQATDQAAREAKSSARAAEYDSNAPVAMSDIDAEAQIKVAISELPGGFDESLYHLITADVNGDGFNEFIALWQDTSATQTVIWKVKLFSQMARGPGEPAELYYSREDRDDFGLHHAVTQYELNGNVLTVGDGAGWTDTRTFQGLPISRELFGR